MKMNLTLFLSLVLLFHNHATPVHAADGFPIHPYLIMKTWNYDVLKDKMGEGREIMGTFRNQKYIAGLGYPFQLLGMEGQLEFYFSRDSISRIQFHHDHPERKIGFDLADRLSRDSTLRKEYNQNIRRLDSLRRDSIIREISLIMGNPVENKPAPPTEKDARHSAVWISDGYSCLYKDYISYSEVVFSIPTVPLYYVGEFGIPTRSELFLKVNGTSGKLSWSASLAGAPSGSNPLIYDDIFLILEYSNGQRYLEPMPNHPVNYLPSLRFEDCNGSGSPQIWVQVPSDSLGKEVRHYIYSIRNLEPNIIFNTDDLVPSSITVGSNDKVSAYFFSGVTLNAGPVAPGSLPAGSIPEEPDGFSYLKDTARNHDGSVNFLAGIGPLEITYQYRNGGWDPASIKIAVKK
jgi:hypothetical protein